MSYVDGFVIACPTANKDKFIAHAQLGDSMFIDLGARRVVEGWGDDVKRGETTDFFMAVKAEEDETVLFSWIEYPDKAMRDKAGEMMMSDPRFAALGEMPFDGKRMIYSGFAPIVDLRK